MTVAYVNSGSVGSTSTFGNIHSSPGWPASVANGNLLILTAQWSSVSATTTYPTGLDASWTLLVATGIVGTNRVAIWWKIADGTENLQPQPVLTNASSEVWVTGIDQYSGNALTTPILRPYVQWLSNNTLRSGPGHMPVKSTGSMMIHMTGVNTALWSPANWTLLTRGINTTGQYFIRYSSFFTTPGFTDNIVYANGTSLVSNNWFLTYEIVASAPSAYTFPRLAATGLGAGGNAITSMTVPLPNPAPVVGNALLLVIQGSPPTVTVSSGWSKAAKSTALGSALDTVHYYWRIVDGTETNPTVTFTLSNVQGYILEFENAANVQPFRNFGTPQGSAANNASYTFTGWNAAHSNILAVSQANGSSGVWDNDIATPGSWQRGLFNGQYYQYNFQEIASRGTATGNWSDTFLIAGATSPAADQQIGFEVWPTGATPFGFSQAVWIG